MNIKIEDIIPRLDEPCRNLLEEVSKHVTISFVAREDGVHYCDYVDTKRNAQEIPIEGTIRFYEPLQVEKIAHELLHAKCSYLLGDNRHLYSFAQQMHPITQIILNRNMCESILNQAEHYIFYKDYANMGYTPDLFVEKVSFDKTGWKFFKQTWKARTNENGVTGIYNLICAMHHILLFPIDNRFRHIEKELKNINGQLYAIFNKFTTSISCVRLEKNILHPIEEDYENLVREIDQWLVENSICIIDSDSRDLRCTRSA